MGFFLPPVSISASFYGYLELFKAKATRKGKKWKEGFEFARGIEPGTSGREGRVLINQLCETLLLKHVDLYY